MVPISLVWNRPTNIPEGTFVIYVVTVNASNSELVFNINVTQASLEFLELADAVECIPVMFRVVASVDGAGDSEAAVFMETLPPCKCMVHLNVVCSEISDKGSNFHFMCCSFNLL